MMEEGVEVGVVELKEDDDDGVEDEETLTSTEMTEEGGGGLLRFNGWVLVILDLEQ